MQRFHVETMRIVFHEMVKAELGNLEQPILQVSSGDVQSNSNEIILERVLINAELVANRYKLQAFLLEIPIRATSARPASSIVYDVYACF